MAKKRSIWGLLQHPLSVALDIALIHHTKLFLRLILWPIHSQCHYTPPEVTGVRQIWHATKELRLYCTKINQGITQKILCIYYTFVELTRYQSSKLSLLVCLSFFSLPWDWMCCKISASLMYMYGMGIIISWTYTSKWTRTWCQHKHEPITTLVCKHENFTSTIC